MTVSEVRNKEQFYFRARLDDGFDRNSIREYSYPPADKTNQGRCNISGHPVFYGSEGEQVAVDEIGVQPGDKYYLSLWSSGESYPNCQIYLWDENAKTERQRRYYGYWNQRLFGGSPCDCWKTFLSESPPCRCKAGRTQMFLQEMTKLFLAKHHSIAAAISHVALRDREYDGIEYLDTKTKSCYNYALSRTFADKLVLDTVLYCKATKTENILVGATGKFIEEKLVWKQFEDGGIWWHNPDRRSGIIPKGAEMSFSLNFKHAAIN